MKLTSFQVTNYRNIEDSGVIPVDGEITCLVGKNESGKTNLLQALFRVNPVTPTGFDVVKDYPRRRLSAYQRRVESGGSHEPVVQATFSLEMSDLEDLKESLGSCIQEGAEVHLAIDYANKCEVCFEVDEAAFVDHMVASTDLPEPVLSSALQTRTLQSLAAVLEPVAADSTVSLLLEKVRQIQADSLMLYVWANFLKERCPKIMYFDEYRLMAGNANLQDLSSQVKGGTNEQYQTLIDLLYLAGVTPKSIINDADYEHHKANIESTANEITEEVFAYWKQNTELEVEFDVHRKAGQNEPPIFYVRIKNTRHKVTVPFDERSKGFVWFFSFMTAFRRLANDNERMIILLDEPGLSLHASAQGDLLRFMEERLAVDHQVLYTTHSPFMIDSAQLLRVRTVEDAPDTGAVVRSDCFGADSATVFPLQAALSYSLAQTLFLGPNCLLVEGPSDLLYLQTVSDILGTQGKVTLDSRWVVTPVGGAGKLSTFASLIGANQLNTCVLMDFAKKDQQIVDNLMKNGFLTGKKVVLYRSFTGGTEADVEDMFGEDTYLELVRRAYPEVAGNLKAKDLPKGVRIIGRIVAAFKNLGGGEFNHLKPSKVAARSLGQDIELDPQSVERFEKLFEHINRLLQKKS